MREQNIAVLKGQGAIELLILVSFFLLFSIPLISILYLSATQSAQDSALLQAKQMSREIIDVADAVYIQGEGARENPSVMFPHNIQSIRANGRELTITVSTSSGHSDVVGMSIGNVVIDGELGTSPGPHVLSITSLGESVEISEGIE